MEKNIIKYAFISSPLLALYGASPFYIFGIVSFEQSLLLFLSVFISTTLYWAFNSYLLIYSKLKSKWKIYVISYIFAYLSNIIKVFIGIDHQNLRSEVIEYIIYPLITVIAINTIVLIVVNSVIKEEQKSIAQKRISELSLENLKAQKQALTQQLQPHFLFNALSVLKSLIKEDQSLAEQYTVQLSNFLRYSVDSQNNEIVEIKDELKFVKDYIELQKTRFGDSFSFNLNVSEKEVNGYVPVFSIQTLVENAFKHNYFTKNKPLNITISIDKETITVLNNLTSLKVTEREGTGLDNLKKRYSLFEEKKIQIHQTQDTFSVSIPILKS